MPPKKTPQKKATQNGTNGKAAAPVVVETVRLHILYFTLFLTCLVKYSHIAFLNNFSDNISGIQLPYMPFFDCRQNTGTGFYSSILHFGRY
jgi:hypothetical protein